MPIDIMFVFLILFGGHFILLRYWVWDHLPRMGKRLVILLYALHFVLIALHYIANPRDDFWTWFLDFRWGEYNPSATYAATQYMLVTLTAIALAIWGRPRALWHRLYWLVLGAAFAYLGLDEYFLLHEGMKNWILIYGAVGAVLALAGLAIFYYGLSRRHLRIVFLIFGGVGFAALGGAGVEQLAALDCFGYVLQFCNRLPMVEEAMENIGILTALVAVLMYAAQQIESVYWKRTRTAIFSGGLLSAIVFLVGPWIIPDLENRLLAQPAVIEYLDTGITVVGYRLSQTSLLPNQSLKLDVYWQKSGRVSGQYGLSAHLVSRSSEQSFAAVNETVEDPAFYQAAPGTIYRSSMRLHLPDDIPAQSSYWLTLALWRDRRPDFIMQPVRQTDRQLLTPDTVILQAVPVLDPAPVLVVDTTARYDFHGDFSLDGYSARVEDRRLTLQFRWENRARLDQSLIQFLHLFDSDGNYVFSVDQPPFADDLPTTDWPHGLRARAEWQVDLPADLPPGDYHLRTGLYDAVTQERQPVTNGEATPLLDYIIDLGSITLEP